MHDSATLLDWISTLGPILFSWPFVIFWIVWYFRRPLLQLLENFSDSDINKAKIGPVEISEDKPSELKNMRFLIDGFVTEQELDYLHQLNGTVPFKHQQTDYFVDELKRLCALGLVKAEGDLEHLSAEKDLRSLVQITDRGKQYLGLRQQIDESESAQG